MRNFLLFLLFLSIKGCKPKGSYRQPDVCLEAEFIPSFSERSLIKFQRIHDTPTLEILIRNNFRVDDKEDTFYHKLVSPTEASTRYFDSLFKDWPRPWKPRAIGVLDGMDVAYTKIEGRDTSTLTLFSPSVRADSFGYRMTSSLLLAFAFSFQDSLINDYFTEVKSYMTDDSAITNAPKPVLFKRREEKYGWKYSR